MDRRNDMIVEWAVKKIEKEYKDDVSLLLTYGSYENGTANPLSDVDFYFIPKTERAYELCKTFIVEGIGFDLFPMSWERVERIAAFNEVLTPCLANVKILYCNSEEDRKRFEDLQFKLNKNLNNKSFMLEKAYKKMEDAMKSYSKAIFEEDICELRTLAGYIVMDLADAVAYANQTYFKRGLKKQEEDLKAMENLPDNFVLSYESVIKSNSANEIKESCRKIIKDTRSFLEGEKSRVVIVDKKANYKGLAELYQEIISTWNKIYVCCDSGNYTLAYISGVCLQNVLNMASEEHGLDKFDLMSAYDSDNLNMFKERAIRLQEKFVKIIENNGAMIESYSNVNEFLEKN